ncbi:MAG: hypothetical protein COV44_10490 [Deltaproteobacteria bacterium CG11_big_fil_rev_8_21_14_0_20_45_16]|nr:MAG: hypothetical protein COV44_10490 [Deltaproteobacteria bacterium CG11_big_fil_rev_8_21_14_0_20_45_16]
MSIEPIVFGLLIGIFCIAFVFCFLLVFRSIEDDYSSRTVIKKYTPLKAMGWLTILMASLLFGLHCLRLDQISLKDGFIFLGLTGLFASGILMTQTKKFAWSIYSISILILIIFIAPFLAQSNVNSQSWLIIELGGVLLLFFFTIVYGIFCLTAFSKQN